MNFLKKWMLNLLILTIVMISPVICGYIIYLLYLLAVHLGILTLDIIFLILASVAITIKKFD